MKEEQSNPNPWFGKAPGFFDKMYEDKEKERISKIKIKYMPNTIFNYNKHPDPLPKLSNPVLIPRGYYKRRDLYGK